MVNPQTPPLDDPLGLMLDPQPDFASPQKAAAHDAWFRAEVAASLADPRPSIPHEQVVADMRAIIAKHDVTDSSTDPARAG